MGRRVGRLAATTAFEKAIIDLMPDPDEALYQTLSSQADLIKARELERGSYFGDGPTTEQLAALLRAMEPIRGASTASAPVLSALFDAAVKTEMTWLFPERDALAGPTVEALHLVQTFAAAALETASPEVKTHLHAIVNLSIVERAARRQQALHGNKIMWRLVLARFLYWLGGGKRNR